VATLAGSCACVAGGLVGALTVLGSYSLFEVSLLRKKKPPPAHGLNEGCALVLDRFKC
jgi:hypothetical protein